MSVLSRVGLPASRSDCDKVTLSQAIDGSWGKFELPLGLHQFSVA
jgi:hypothetical protein